MYNYTENSTYSIENYCLKQFTPSDARFQSRSTTRIFIDENCVGV